MKNLLSLLILTSTVFASDDVRKSRKNYQYNLREKIDIQKLKKARSEGKMPSLRFGESSENNFQPPKHRPKRVKRIKTTTNPSRVSERNPSIDPRIDHRLLKKFPDARRTFYESLEAKERELRKQRLSRRHGSDDLLGRWKENDNTQTYTLTLGSNQSIPNPLQAIGAAPSEGAISVQGGDLDKKINYLGVGHGAISWDPWWYTWADIEWPAVALWFSYNDDMPYVFHPDTVGLDIYHFIDDTSIAWLGEIILDGKDAENLTISAGDVLWEGDEYWPTERLILGMSIKDSLVFTHTDSTTGNSTNYVVKGDLKMGMLDLIAGIPYPVQDPYELIWGEWEDSTWVETNYLEFMSGQTGLFINHIWDGWYDPPEEWTDSSDFVWSSTADEVTITEEVWEWDDENEEEITFTDTYELNYKVENEVLTLSDAWDFCDEGWEWMELDGPLSPYACGDSIKAILPLFGLNDVESLIIEEKLILDYDGATGTVTRSEFRKLFPSNETVVEITTENAWTDALVFAWDDASPFLGDGITYDFEFTGDLGVLYWHLFDHCDSKTNTCKIPYHRIEDYLSIEGLEKTTGTWDIKATGKIEGGYSLKFDQDGDYISFGDNDVFDFSSTDVSGFSYSVWLNTSNTDFQQILCKRGTGGSYEMQIDWWEGGTVNANYVTSSAIVADGKWHNVIVTYDFNTSEAKMYIDGVEDATGTIESDYSASSDGPLHIGADSFQGEYFDGFIKEVAIWVDALDANDVTDIYNFGKGVDLSTNSVLGGDNGIRGYWPLNAGFGDIVTDVASTRSTDPVVNGTIYGAQWTTENPILNWYNDSGEPVEVSMISSNGPFELTIDASSLAVADEGMLPTNFSLHANFPNPFNPTTSIKYDLPENADVSLMIYDIMGREIRHLVNEIQNAGFKAIMWDGTNNYGHQVGTGMYLYQIRAGSFLQTRKMILMK